MKKILFVLFTLSTLATSCFRQEPTWGNDTSRGMKPLYVPKVDAFKISVEAPRLLTESSKIYYKDKYIFIIEQGVGVHVVDNRDSTKPQNVKFLRIFGCSDIAIRGNTMYADNLNDLVSIDFSKIDSPVVTSRIPNLYRSFQTMQEFPPDFSGYFECADTSKGTVIGWKESTLDNPQCRR
jgi:hypothetical protein